MKAVFNNIERIEYGWLKIYYQASPGFCFLADDILNIIQDEKRAFVSVLEMGEDHDGPFMVIHLRDWRYRVSVGKADVSLLFSPRTSVKGYSDFYALYGYWPSFHDDEIVRVEMNSKGITFTVKMLTRPENMEEYPIIELIFSKIKESMLNNWYLNNSFSELHFSYDNENIRTELFANLGLNGLILSRDIGIKVVGFETE